MKKVGHLSNCSNSELFRTDRQKKQKLVGGWEYGMERLPDEILIVILSGLTLKEAARTSVLCHRWRYLWHYVSGSLVFDEFSIPQKYQFYSDSFGSKVDQILKLHRSPSVDKFIVRCPKMACYPGHITNWVRFAIQKNVKVFELSSNHDEFPDLYKFCSISRAIKRKDISGLSSLTSLSLVQLNIKGKMVQFLLYNCPLLQHLCLRRLSGLKKLNVDAGSSLKSLIINLCYYLKDLTISAPNLVSFEYRGKYERLVKVENVPLLSDLTLTEESCWKFLYYPEWSSKYSNQLVKLSLHFPSRVYAPLYFSDSCFPRLQCLKHLELVLDTVNRVSFLDFVLLTKICPFLSTFVVQFIYKLSEAEEVRKHFFPRHNFGRKLACARAALKAYSHEYLKVVKLMNMAFHRCEVSFALSLIQIAKSVEKVIIKPDEKRIATALERVKQLKAILPPSAELMII